jgi:predicted phosphoribosyltransferase
MIFKDRSEAGQKLAKELEKYKDKNVIVFTIPNGGVPVGYEIAKKLNCPLDVLIVREILYPWTTEAGFGAVDPEGGMILEKDILTQIGITKKIIDQQVEKAKRQLKEKIKKFRKEKTYSMLDGETVILVDDGLATGYSMLMSIKFLKKKKAEKIVVAVSTASQGAYEKVKKEADEIICLDVRTGFPFAVADAYQNWYDVPDKEALKYLKNFKK